MPGEGGNGGEGKGAGSDVQQQLTDALVKLGTAEAENKTLGDAKGDLERKLDDADKELLGEDYLAFKDKKAKGSAKPDPDKGGGAAAPLDLDTASNAEIENYIETKFQGNIDKAIGDLGTKLDASNTKVSQAFAQVDVALCMNRHSDFAEHKDAIFKVAKENPTWGAEKCYEQFTLEAKKVKDDADVAAKKKEEEDLKVRTEKGGGAAASTTTDKEMTSEEAGDLAYRQSFEEGQK